MSRPSPTHSLVATVRATERDVTAAVCTLAQRGLHIERLGRQRGLGWLRVDAAGEGGLEGAREAVHDAFGPRLLTCCDLTLAVHAGGKIRVDTKVPIRSADDLALQYTPGVGRAAASIAARPDAVMDLTGKANTVAIVSDGSAVLGGPDLGPAAVLPALEGRAMAFARFAGLNGVPLALRRSGVEAAVHTLEAVAPGFGAVLLVDMETPRCLAIERRLRQGLDIPVFCDDRSTAVAVLAALRTALQVVGTDHRTAWVAVVGEAMRAAMVGELLLRGGVDDVVVCDQSGVVEPAHPDPTKPFLARIAAGTNRRGLHGGLRRGLAGADALVLTSGGPPVPAELVRTMAPDPVVIDLAVPGLLVDEAAAEVAVLAGTDPRAPNFVDSMVVTPGLLRGSLDTRMRCLDEGTELAIADALVELTRPLASLTHVVPEPFDPKLVPTVAIAVQRPRHPGLRSPRCSAESMVVRSIPDSSVSSSSSLEGSRRP